MLTVVLARLRLRSAAGVFVPPVVVVGGGVVVEGGGVGGGAFAIPGPSYGFTYGFRSPHVGEKFA
jgi:hypothetical protein